MKALAKLFLLVTLLASALSSSYFALEAYLKVKIAEKINRRISKLPFTFTAESLDYTLLSNTVTLRKVNLDLPEMPLKVEKVRVDLPFTLEFKKAPPKLFLEVTGIELSPFKKILPVPGEKAHIKFHYEFSNSGFTAFLDAMIPSVCRVSVACSVDNLEREKLQKLLKGTVPERKTIRELRITHLEFKYTDMGLVEDFIRKQADSQGLTEEEFKARLIRSLKRGTEKNPKLFERVVKPVSAFIDKPECIEVSVNPSTPVPLKELKRLAGELQELKSELERLNIKVQVCGSAT